MTISSREMEGALTEARKLVSGVYHTGNKHYAWNEYDSARELWVPVTPKPWPHARTLHATRIAEIAHKILTGQDPRWNTAYYGPAVKRLQAMLQHHKQPCWRP